MAVKRRVGLRIDPYQKARAMEKGRKQEAENGLGAVRARCMSTKFATGAPVTASGCKQQRLPQHRGCACEGTVNQGGTTEVCSAPVLVRASGPKARTGAFFMHPFKAACGTVPCGPQYILY